MSLKLLSNNWSLEYDEIITGSRNKLLVGNYNSNYLAIFIDSVSKNPNWNNGGLVAQQIIFEDGTVALANTNKLLLGQLNLIEFPIISQDSYNLYYLGLERLTTTTIKIYKYLGETQESLLPLLTQYLENNATFNVDLSLITNQLNVLEANVNMLLEPRQILYRVFDIDINGTKEIRFWENPDIQDGIRIESLYIDSPEDDRFNFELLDFENNHITEFEFKKNQTPFAFPKLEFSKYVRLKIKALNNNGIGALFLYVTPIQSPLLFDVD